MELIACKNIFLLIRDTLRLIDSKVVDHGYRVAYLVCKMLEQKGGYQAYELADIAILATLHDIGLYKTGGTAEMVYYEAKDTNPHSVYGYLFCKYLAPREEGGIVLLHHHTDYDQLPADMTPRAREICAVLSVADKMDIYRQWLEQDFDCHMFDKYAGSKLSGEALSLFYQVEETHGALGRLQDGSFEKEMGDLLEYMIFSNEETQSYLKMLMYGLGFRSEGIVVDTVTRLCTGGVIGEKLMLTPYEQEILYYGSLLCDIGMLAVPKEIIEAPRKLTPEEQKILRRHVDVAERMMKDRVHSQVLALVTAHHERGDGTGYPKRLREGQMTQMQRVLQVADVMAALMNERPYRRRKTRQEIISILGEERNKGRLSRQIVDTMLAFYDEILKEARKQEQEVLSTYRKMHSNYEAIEKKLEDKK